MHVPTEPTLYLYMCYSLLLSLEDVFSIFSLGDENKFEAHAKLLRKPLTCMSIIHIINSCRLMHASFDFY